MIALYLLGAVGCLYLSERARAGLCWTEQVVVRYWSRQGGSKPSVPVPVVMYCRRCFARGRLPRRTRTEAGRASARGLRVPSRQL